MPKQLHVKNKTKTKMKFRFQGFALFTFVFINGRSRERESIGAERGPNRNCFRAISKDGWFGPGGSGGGNFRLFLSHYQGWMVRSWWIMRGYFRLRLLAAGEGCPLYSLW